MHAKIAWEPALSLDVASAASDIVAVLTGETNKANLSSFVSQGGTTIASTYPAGWEVWDSSTGTANEYVLRAPCDGDATQYKYVKLRFHIISSYLYCGHQLMEDWNPTTNTPTNACTEVVLNYTRHPLNSYNSNQVFHVFATPRYIAFRATVYAQTMTFPCMEISRVHPCFEVGSGYLPAIQMNTTQFSATNLTTYLARIPRVLDDAGTADLINQDLRMTNGGFRPETNVNLGYDQFSETIAYNSSGTPFYQIENIIFERRDLIGQVCGDSTTAGVFIAQGGVVTGFEDETLHTLDTTDDYRCIWRTTENITSHGNVRYFFPAE